MEPHKRWDAADDEGEGIPILTPQGQQLTEHGVRAQEALEEADFLLQRRASPFIAEEAAMDGTLEHGHSVSGHSGVQGKISADRSAIGNNPKNALKTSKRRIGATGTRGRIASPHTVMPEATKLASTIRSTNIACDGVHAEYAPYVPRKQIASRANKECPVVCGQLIQEFFERRFAVGRMAAEVVKAFDALNLAPKPAHILICGRVGDNQNEVHVRDGFHPTADRGATEQNHTDQRPSTIGTRVDNRVDIRLHAKRNR